MGYNTSMIILNDGLRLIAEDKDFGKKIQSAALSFKGKSIDISSGGFANIASVVETHHADSVSVVAFGGNCGVPVMDNNLYGYWSANDGTQDGRVKILKAIAEELGYSIRKKPKK